MWGRELWELQKTQYERMRDHRHERTGQRPTQAPQTSQIPIDPTEPTDLYPRGLLSTHMHADTVHTDTQSCETGTLVLGDDGTQVPLKQRLLPSHYIHNAATRS